MADSGVNGPLFISVGKPEQLDRFLSLNQELGLATALVDDSEDFSAYKAAGFNYLMGDKNLEQPPAFKAPKQMGVRKWISYLRNVLDLAPKPAQGETFPNGVKVLGGTYAINGSDVEFSWMDVVPGATPEIEAVLKTVGA